MNLKIVAVTPLLFLLSNAFAGTHTWVGPTIVRSSSVTAKGTIRPNAIPTQTVVVTGSTPSISFGSGSFDTPFEETPLTFQGGNGIANAIASSVAKALKLTHACTNPAISEEARNTTSGYDATGRWLAASSMFGTVQQANLLGMAGKAYGGIGIVVGGVKFDGFKVYYHDGASEVWPINPAANVLSDKLIDTPVPGTLTAPNPKDGC